jgi:hypothetical protein
VAVTPRRRVDIIRKRAEPAGAAEPDRRNPDRQRIERYMRTTTIIAALVLATVGAPAQADYQHYFDPPEQLKQQTWEAPIVRPFLDGSCPGGYTKSGSFCVPWRGGGGWIAIPPGGSLTGKQWR